MSILPQFFIWLYSRSLYLYPEAFRTEFGAEMQAVFEQAICESGPKALSFCLRELKDLPGSLIRQYWFVLNEVTLMTNLTKSKTEDRQPGSWGAATLAGLPHLLMGLLIGLGKFFVFDLYGTSQTISIITGLALTLLVAGMLILALRRGWPLWSASWYFYGTWVLLMVAGLVIERLNLEESWRYTTVMFLGWILICILGYFWILSKSKLHGLLSVAFLFPMLSIVMMEFIPNPIEGWLAISVGLLASLTAGAIVRIGIFRLALGLIFSLNLTVGLIWAYISEYKMLDLPPGLPAHVPKFGNFLEFLAIYSIFGLGIVALPFILRTLWIFGKRKLIP